MPPAAPDDAAGPVFIVAVPSCASVSLSYDLGGPSVQGGVPSRAGRFSRFPRAAACPTRRLRGCSALSRRLPFGHAALVRLAAADNSVSPCWSRLAGGDRGRWCLYGPAAHAVDVVIARGLARELTELIPSNLQGMAGNIRLPGRGRQGGCSRCTGPFAWRRRRCSPL